MSEQCCSGGAQPEQPCGCQGRGGMFKGCLIGCGIIVFIGAIILGYGAWQFKKIGDSFTNITTEVELDLNNSGLQAGGEKIGGKGMLDTIKMLATDINLDKSPTTGVYYLGNDLSVNAPCAGDVLFVGNNCYVNQPIAGRLLFYSLADKNGTLTLADNATVGKIIVNEAVNIVGNKDHVKDGISNNFEEVLNFTALEKNLREKFGDEAVEEIKKQLFNK